MGHKVAYTTLEQAILTAGLKMTAEGKEIFDTSVYKEAEQLLGCVGCYKAHDDPRELVPFDASRPWSDYLVQHLQGDEVMVESPKALLTQPRQEADVESPTSGVAEIEDIQTFGKISPMSANFEELKGLMKSLSVSRATSYETWRDVGFALKSAVGAGIKDAELLTLFDDFSKTAGQAYDREGVIKQWHRAKPEGGITVGSLYHWANEDGPKLGKTYKAMKAEFGRTHFKVMHPFIYATELKDKVILEPRRTFLDKHENLQYKVRGKDKQVTSMLLIARWMKDSTIRTYDRVDFLPPKGEPSAAVHEEDRVYNTWRGLHVERLAFTPEDLATVDLACVGAPPPAGWR